MKSYFEQMDYGPEPCVISVEQMAMENKNFRTAIWTGDNIQMTLMSIPKCGEIGLEMHEDTDQFLRVEQGCAVVKMGECKCTQDFRYHIHKGDVVFVPAGTWLNIIYIGRMPLKISSIYAPPNHPRGTVEPEKGDEKD